MWQSSEGSWWRERSFPVSSTGHVKRQSLSCGTPHHTLDMGSNYELVMFALAATPHPWCPPQAHGSRFLDCFGGICRIGDAEWEGGIMQTSISSSHWLVGLQRSDRLVTSFTSFQAPLLLRRCSFGQFENAVQSCWVLLTLLRLQGGCEKYQCFLLQSAI